MSSNPLPVIPLDYAHAHDARPRRLRTLTHILLVSAWLACVAAWLAIVGIDVESVMVSGPAIGALGLALVIAALLGRRAAPAIIGAAHVGICLLFFGLVQWRTWSPAEANLPFVAMGVVHIALSGLVTAWSILGRAGARAGLLRPRED